ncbi:PDZ domain-containing protein [bacterium]|nr:PDZ domain-containing protein [Candidatus Elulimicrobium humile]
MSTELNQQKIANIVLISVLASSLTGFLGGGIAFSYIDRVQHNTTQTSNLNISEEQSAIIDLVEKSNQSVVSISISKKIQVRRQSPIDYFFGIPLQDNSNQGSEDTQTIGGGTGFIVSSDGLIITNKHVVSDSTATYKVLFNDGSEVKAEVKVLHPTKDLAIIKVDRDNLKPVEFSDSEQLKVGQTAVAIGNALNEFDNTVSRGVISGLRRSIIASDTQGNSEQLSQVIQTDAAINQGNSGGPLLDINAKVIGVNVATAQGAQSIGFAIPSNVVVRMIEDYKKFGKVKVPFIGVRYNMIIPGSDQAKEYGVENGALIIGDAQAPAIVPNSPASKAGLQTGDIITKINDKSLSIKQPLVEIVSQYKVGDKIELLVIRDGGEKKISLTLEERPE